jgi:multiple sugar transport system permease protein
MSVTSYELFGDRLGGYLTRNRIKYVLTLPAVLYAVMWVIYPMLDVLVLSVQSDGAFVGLENYIQVLTSNEFHGILVNTFVFTAPVVALEVVFGVALAVAFNAKFRFKGTLRTIMLIPLVLTPFAVGMMFRWFFSSSLGIVNYVFTSLGLPSYVWLGEPTFATIAIIVAEVWQWTPFVFLMTYTAMQNVPQNIIEAARIDGASSYQRFRYIILPYILPVLMITVLIRLILILKSADKVFAMTDGGPAGTTTLLPMFIYEQTFVYGSTSRSASTSVLLLVLILALGYLFIYLLSYTRYEV